jgi:LCP family protein required for cell wall assembly
MTRRSARRPAAPSGSGAETARIERPAAPPPEAPAARPGSGGQPGGGAPTGGSGQPDSDDDEPVTSDQSGEGGERAEGGPQDERRANEERANAAATDGGHVAESTPEDDSTTAVPATATPAPADDDGEPSRGETPEETATETAPGTAARPRRGPLARVFGALAALLSASILGVSAFGYVFYHELDNKVTRIHLDLSNPFGGSSGPRPASAPPGSENYLLVGSDSRAGTGSEYDSSGPVTGERSDTTMLAHLDTNGTTTLVSFPRDTVVSIPRHGRNKLNAAISIGGPQLLIQTLERLTDIRIDHFVSIDLAGFKAMTDAIGGVTVCVAPLPGGSTSNLHDNYSRWSGHLGENTLDGEQALAFVRQRYGLPDGDFDRIRRQQQFISAVFRKASAGGVLTSPTHLDALLGAAASSLTVDQGTSINDLRRLATRLRGMSASSISFETIPVHTPTAANRADLPSGLRGASVQIYDPATLEAFLAPIRGRSVALTPAVAPLPPGQVQVAVANGTTHAGLATRVLGQLRAAGFAVTSVVSSDDHHVSQTEIHYSAGLVAAAEALAAAVPDATLVEDHAADPVLTLVLGTSFAGVTSPADGALPPSPTGTTNPVSPTDASPSNASPTNAGPNSAGPNSAGPNSAAPASPSPTASTAAELTQRCTY